MFFETHGIVVVLSLGVAKLEKLIKVQVWGFASWICRFLLCVHVARVGVWKVVCWWFFGLWK
jgi:hypothetical protein